jgi:hypothetical protein
MIEEQLSYRSFDDLSVVLESKKYKYYEIEHMQWPKDTLLKRNRREVAVMDS